MLHSVVNFRSVSASGCLRPGRLFRSGNCGNITDQDAQRLVSMHGIRTVIDLRSDSERLRLGGLDRLARKGIRCIDRPLHMDPRFRELNDVQVHDYIRLYLHMVKFNRSMLAEIVTAAAGPAAAPLLITCGMGKDRTGVVCGLLLGLLGGSDEEIAEDYARSGPPLTACLERFRVHWLRRGITREAYARRLLCDGAIMRGWCEHVRRREGRWDGVVCDLGLGESVLDDLAHNLAMPGSSARHALRPSSSATVPG